MSSLSRYEWLLFLLAITPLFAVMGTIVMLVVWLFQ